MDLGQVVPPGHVQLGVLVLQRLQGFQQGVGVGVAVRPVVQHRFQQRRFGIRLGPQPLPRAGGGRPGHRYHHAGDRGVHQPELAAVVQPQGVRFLAPRQYGLDRQFAAGHFQPAQPGAGVVLTDLEDACPEIRPHRRHPGQRLQALEQPIQTVQPQRRTKKAGKYLPPGNRRHQGVGLGGSVSQYFLHQRLTAQRQRLGVRLAGEIHTAVPEPPPQFPQAYGGIGTGQIHLVHKHKGGHPVPGQQLPQRFGVGLYAVGPADHQHRIVQHLQGALGFGGKIHVARRIQQRQLGFLGTVGGRQRQHGLLGKNRDAPGAFLAVGIQKSVPVIHPTQLAQHARAVQKPFGQRGFAAVHMGQKPHDQTFHNHSPLCIVLLLYLFWRKMYSAAVYFRKLVINPK